MSFVSSERSNSSIRLLYLDPYLDTRAAFLNRYGDQFRITAVASSEEAKHWLSCENEPDVILADVLPNGMTFLKEVRSHPIYQSVPVIMLAEVVTAELKKNAFAAHADDLFAKSIPEGNLSARIEYFVKRRELLRNRKKNYRLDVTISWGKRLFDMLVSGGILLLLSPLLLLVAVLIKLDSKGPVLYTSKRVGSGYTIFGLYKFRTMRTGADTMLRDLSAYNMYNKTTELETEAADHCHKCAATGNSCEAPLFVDGRQVCEKTFLRNKKEQVAFVKFQNDPRITRLGAFLRNTSIDELPQLLNILRGDMSLVGNRPLPLYEAEKLTTDQAIQRFAAPAGLTGLWQVTKRGTKEMSEEERIRLDIEYARNHSFWVDLKIILKTFPALLQKENV